MAPEPGNTPPRALRVSNVHELKLLGWMFALGLLVWPACAWKVAPLLGRAAPSDVLGWAAAVGFMYIPVFCVLAPVLSLFTLGTWIVDERGIEFVPPFPRLRRRRYVRWDRLERVRWTYKGAELDAGANGRMQIGWNQLRRRDGELLRERVEAALSPRFDLSLGSPERTDVSPDSLRRLATLAVGPVGFVVFCYTMAMRSPTNMRLWVGLMVGPLMIAYFAAVIGSIVRVQRAPQSPLRWRLPAGPAAG
jgi:hypothetical protein